MRGSETRTCQIIINVYSLRLLSPLQGLIYLQYNLSDSKTLQRSPEIPSNQGELCLRDMKLISFSIGRESLERVDLLVSLFLKSEGKASERRRDQLVGTLSLPVELILTQQQYQRIQEYPFEMSAVDAFITLACQCTFSDSITSSSHRANLKNITFKTGEDPQKQEGQAPESYSPPSHNESLTPESSKRSYSKSWEELLVHRGSFFSDSNVLKSMDSNQAIEERIKKMENLDLQQLLKENYRLERLLYLSRNERKIESSRHEQDMKELARELSIKEAEVIKLKEDLDGAHERAGQLLDECENMQKEKEEVQHQLQNEKITCQKLQISYEALSMRIGQMCQESQRSSALREELAATLKEKLQAEQQLSLLHERQKALLGQVEELEKKLWQSQQQYQEMEVHVNELREEVKSKDQMVSICKEYERKLSELEDKIDSIEEEGDFVHRIEYSSPYDASSDKIRIEEDECHLKRIVEEQLEESFPSLDDHVRHSEEYVKDIVTATTLIDPVQRSQFQLLQLLTQNLERQHSQLKRLYRQQEMQLASKHIQLQGLEKSLAQMRYEFLLQLSKVTALMNQQVIENSSLRQANLQLSFQLEQYQQKVQEASLTKPLPPHQAVENSTLQFSSFERVGVNLERDYLRRCRQLQQENQMLLKYNLERQQLYEMIIGNRLDTSDLIVQRFENSLKYILHHREHYGSLLRNYGFNQDAIIVNNSNTSIANAQRYIQCSQVEGNLSDIIHNFNPARSDNQSQIKKFDAFQSHNELLLLQSTAKDAKNDQELSPSHNLQTAISELTDLYKERERMSTIAFKRDKAREQDDKLKEANEICSKIQKLKVMLIREGKTCSNANNLATFCELEQAIQQFCFT